MTLDTGFRVLKVTESCIKENGKVDRDTPHLDLFFEAMIKTGVMPSKPFKSGSFGGNALFETVTELMACFDENISDEALNAITDAEPLFLVVADRSKDWSALLPKTIVKFIEFEETQDK